VRRVATRLKLNYPVLFGTSEIMDAYGVGEALPVTIVVDQDGKIRSRILGILYSEEFNERVARLLETKEVRN